MCQAASHVLATGCRLAHCIFMDIGDAAYFPSCYATTVTVTAVAPTSIHSRQEGWKASYVGLSFDGM